MVREDNRTFERPRGQAWGNEAQRAVLHAIAEDVARRAGHRVAVIEALRSDGNLEFVAIAGSPDGSERLMGEATPLLMMDRLVAAGAHVDGWVHLPAERIDDETRAWVDQYGHTPDVPGGDGPDAWHPEDLLLRVLTSEDGAVRAVLWLDEPLSGLRPTPETIAAVNGEIAVMYEAIVSIVERELYGEHVRMVTQARTAVRSVRPGLEVEAVMRELADAMVEAMPIDFFDVLLAGATSPPLEPYTAELEEHMREVWLRRGHVVIEPDRLWGVAGTAVPTPAVMATAMEERGLGSLLLMPIGMGEEYLGTMGLGREVGGPRWIDSEINAAAAVASDLAGVVVDARIMDRERLLNAELREINDHRRDMVVTLAHELRNPVSVLWTHLELLGHDSATGTARESLEAMDRAARRIEDMTEALMALAAVSDPDRAVTPVPVDLSAVVREGCAFLAPVAARDRVALDANIADGVVVVGEESAIQRMVANLLSNAVKYTHEGGRVAVTLEAADSEDDSVRLTCADTGIGISAADLPHVFTPFFRSGDPAARARPGTGLGLSILERVVRAHEGTVEVTSEVGAGTTFVVRLPPAPDDAPAQVSEG
ncbi:HAMP domain-containing histidine kinase [Nocardioides glacieisoli]|uniref:histidine kinase n=1 Tax=Nocardioides glacieisoli TaxID=1168730 RepID=A0A4Q2RPP7_9ACTN|nr:HAMP domain-containing sensor histidine kinase [Nocardioides glacieisoli]RYB89173.1 HAMP domain-containing histidine kinase [Nocardioides glacieisoli]